MSKDVSGVRVLRSAAIAEQVLFLDGLTGTGKTMLAPILSTLRRVEVQRIEHIYEYICHLRFLGRIEEDAAIALIRMYADIACYNAMIARESNFRYSDLSGVLSNPGGWRYLLRLFKADGEAVVTRIKRERPILQLVSHGVPGAASLLFSAMGERLTLVEMVRHPLYLIEHWYSYMHRWGTDPRDFAICLKHGEANLPWFALGWEEKYLACNKMDRVIYTLEWLLSLFEQGLSGLGQSARGRVVVIPFEHFVMDPWPFLSRLEELLRSRRTWATNRLLRKQKVPRQLWTDGRDLKIYRRYAWEPPSKNSTEAHELRKRWDFAATEASKESMRVLGQLCEEYERKYLKQDLRLDSFAGGDSQGAER